MLLTAAFNYQADAGAENLPKICPNSITAVFWLRWGVEVNFACGLFAYVCTCEQLLLLFSLLMLIYWLQASLRLSELKLNSEPSTFIGVEKISRTRLYGRYVNVGFTESRQHASEQQRCFLFSSSRTETCCASGACWCQAGHRVRLKNNAMMCEKEVVRENIQIIKLHGTVAEAAKYWTIILGPYTFYHRIPMFH